MQETIVKTHLPAEWARQSGVMLTWPHSETIWAETLAAADQVFTEITKQISLREKIIISCFDDKHATHIKHLLKAANVNLQHIAIYTAPCDDIWVRDHGPITVLKQTQPLLLDFTFNGWGNKYPAENDNYITRSLHAQHAFGDTPLTTIDMVLEGGGIEVDGQGTLLTTSSYLLAKTRNPVLTRAEITNNLQRLFGIKKILWLDHGYLAGDDTDGHIDTLARFTDAHTICYTACSDPHDEHFTALKAMEDQLQGFTDYQNQPYQLIPLPWPRARFADYDGRRLPLTYANFLIINDAVLVPTYADPADAHALKILASCFPNRQIIPIPCLPIVQWYGSLHCMTMQLPEGVL